MNYRRSLSMVVAFILSINSISLADLCLKVKDVSGGEFHTLALMEDKTLWACGDNDDKQLGLGNISGTPILEQVKGEDGVGFLQNIATFDAGWFHSLAADEDGMIWAWGKNTKGQLGDGDDLPVNECWDVPHKVHGVGDVGYLGDTVDIVQVSAGRSGQHSLAVDDEGHVYAWGYNFFGQCGIEMEVFSLQVPYQVHDGDPNTTDVYLGGIVQAEAGVEQSIARDNEGYVWHWGRWSSMGGYPEKVRQVGGALLTNIIDISCCDYAVAVDDDGHVWQWRYSNAAEMVAGGEMETEYLENIEAVGTGNNCFMALTDDGMVLTWNWGGSPVYVPAGQMVTNSGYLENIAVIDGGYTHRLAISENGSGWAWGDNSDGRLGIGTTTPPMTEPALMSCVEKSAPFYLEKTAVFQVGEPNCVQPFDPEEENYLVYEICYGNPETDPNDPDYVGTLTNVLLIDTLPDGVEFYSASDGGAEDWETGTVIWDLDTLAAGANDCVTLTVKVSEAAEPRSQIVNVCEITADNFYSLAEATVNVCCWGGDKVFVRAGAEGYGNGIDWANAYTNLQDALARAGECGDEIWVARGMYSPGEGYDDTFTIPANVAVYGGFSGNEDPDTFDLADRNFQANKTYLSGNDVCNTTVTIGDETILDGFIVEKAVQDGIYGNAVDFVVKNCVLNENNLNGIRGIDGNISILWCDIKDNGNNGIDVQGSNKSVYVENCKIFDNDWNGIFSQYSTPTILNSIIHHNASDISYYSDTYHGIKLYYPSSTPEIRNNTIVYNSNEGIYFTGVNEPYIDNCILWGNDENDGCFQFTQNCLPTYTCYFDPNDPNGYSTPDGFGNIKCPPLFAYPNPNECNNYHLDPNSPCRDHGNTNLVGSDELDIDGEYRIDDTIVDMGADEVHCEDIYNPLDWAGADGLVNLLEFSDMAAAWLSMDPNQIPEPDPNDSANWNPICDLDKDLDVDIDDLVLLCDEWLWRACWRDTEEMMGMMMMAPGGGESVSFSAASFSASASLAKTTPAEEPVPMATLEEMTTWLEEIYGDNEEFQLGYSPQEWQEFIDEVKATWDDSW